MACQHITAKMPFLTFLDTIHLASCSPHHQTWCISMTPASSSKSVNHSQTVCLPMLKLALTIWWKTYFQVDIDNLMEDLFWSQRTMPSSSTNFLHTNFCGGATHLTMPSSHHWPGILFSFLLMLLTPTRRELCSNCFQENDVNVDGYDLDEALAWILNMSTHHQYWIKHWH